MPNVVERADVRVVQGTDRPCLTLEAFTQHRVATDMRGQDLYSNRAIEARVLRFVDLSLAPCTEVSDDFIRPEASTGTEGHELLGSAARIVTDLIGRFCDPDANQSAP